MLFRCCGQGAVVIPEPPEYPVVLAELLSSCLQPQTQTQKPQRTPKTRDFHQLIRQYNNAFSFASLGSNVKWDRSLIRRQTTGTYTFKVQGQLYHQIGALHPDAERNAAFAQLYIFDGHEEELRRRGIAFQGLDTAVTEAIQHTLHRCNPYIQSLRCNAERIRADSSVSLRIQIVESKATDPRRYNAPTVPEVAALIPSSSERPIGGTRSIVLHNRQGPLRRISEQCREYVALRYPLLFPHGEPGWFFNFPRRNLPWQPRGETLSDESPPDGDGNNDDNGNSNSNGNDDGNDHGEGVELRLKGGQPARVVEVCAPGPQ